MKPVMNSRRINTPFISRPSHPQKKAFNESEDIPSPQSNNSIKFSSKSRNFPFSNVLGCTAYPKGNYTHVEKRQKSPTRKKILIPIHKTTFNWALHNDYGKSKDNLNLSKRKNETELPEIPLKENTKFIPNPISEKRDEYIRYIANIKKKLPIESRENIRNGNKKTRNTKLKEDFSVDSAKRDSNDIKTFNLGGISFEVRAKGDTSSINSLEYMKTSISKEMNLMFYDFNGAKKRMNSESPRPEDVLSNGKRIGTKIVYPSKTTGKFFQRKKQSNKQPTDKTTSFHDIKNCDEDYVFDGEETEGERRSKKVSNFVPLANNSKVKDKRLVVKKLKKIINISKNSKV